MSALCPEHDQRAAMTDAEFWAHVFGPTDAEVDAWNDYHWSMNGPDVWAIECARCQRTVEVLDPEHRERDAFCDDCADELLPDSEVRR